MAIADFLAGLFYGNFRSKPLEQQIEKLATPEPEVPIGYKLLYFNCWLCSGPTKFACKPLKKDKKFNVDCQWCGVENLVSVHKEK